MKKSTKIGLALTPAFSLVLIAVLWLTSVKPWIIKTVKNQLSNINNHQNIVTVDVEKFDFSLTKLQAKVTNTKITLNKDSKNIITLPNIRLQVDPFNLLIGQLNISYLRIDNANISLNDTILNLTPENQNKEIDLSLLFNFLPKVPVEKIILNKTELTFDLPASKSQAKSRFNSLTLTNKNKSLLIALSGSEHELLTNNVSKITGASVHAQMNAELFEDKLVLNKLLTEVENSSLVISGSIDNLKYARIKPEYSLNTNGLIIFENLKPFYYFFDTSSKRLPKIFGQLHVKGYLKGSGFKNNSGNLSLQTQNMQLDFIKFGDAKITMSLKNNSVSFDGIKLDHPAGTATVSNLEFSQEKPFKFKSKLTVEKFNLQKLFKSLDLKDIPADLDISALGNCQGQLSPLNIQCETKAVAENLWVKSDIKNKHYIVQVKKALIHANVNSNNTELTFDTKVNLNKSDFTGSGKVNYSTGFEMLFKSNNFEISNIDNLADLNMKGLIQGELSTSGDSSHGIINAKLSGVNFEIDKFHLGNITTDLSYRSSEMTLNNISGELEQSLYNGNIKFNFNNETLSGDLLIPKLKGQSVLTALQDRFYLPFSLTGQGKASIKLTGPFDFWKLKYQLNSELSHGSIANESFTQLKLILDATDNKINFSHAVLSKPTGQISLSGHINTENKEPKFLLDFSSQNLKLEETDNFIKIVPKSTGLINLNGKIIDTLENIQVLGQTSVRDFISEGQSLQSSQGDFKITRDYFSFNGQIFGRQAQCSVKIPFSTKAEFNFKANLRDLNFLSLLPLIKIPPPSVDTSSLITADIDINAPTLETSKFKGNIKIDSFLLSRSHQTLKLQKPSEISFNSGLKSIQPINLHGTDQTLTIVQSGQVLNFKGNLSARLFQFLIPALENLNGLLNFDFGINLNSSKLSLAGSGFFKTGLVQIKGFPYPIKDINATLDFSQSKLVVSDVSAQLNQSPLTGSGYINFLSSNNIEVNLQAEVPHLDLEFPPQMQTSGQAKVKVFGHWMPYTLKIDYLVDRGLVSKEFTGSDEDTKLTLAPSRFLPEKQLNQQIPTLLLDVNPKFPKGIIIKNSLLEGVATGELRITGSPEIPIISGRVNLAQGSKLFFKDKPFDVQTGFVIFNPGDKNSPEINPEIFMNTNARVTDYDINLLISGQAKSLTIRPTSQPPLSENDIFSLLALGFTSSNQNLSSETQQNQTGLEVLASVANQSKINKQLQEKLGLNIQIAPSVDSTKNIAVPKVVVSRKITKKINASYSRPLSGTQQSNEVKLQWLFHPNYSLNLNYQNQSDTNETGIIQNNEKDTGNYGVDLEYKKEFK